MKIFITGGTGFIGRSFISHLSPALKPEDRCLVLTRMETSFEDNRITGLLGTLEDISRYRDEILSCEYFFHLGANATFLGDTIDYDKVNYEPTMRIVDILKESGCLKNFIFTSTIGAVDRHETDDCRGPLTIKSIPSPTSEYGRSKLRCEEYIAKSNIPYTIIRPSWVYGRDMRTNSHINQFVSMVYRRSFVPYLNFPGKVSLIHVDDVSKALVNCLDNKQIVSKTYFAETEAMSIGDIFKAIYKKVYKRDISQIRIPRFHFIFGMLHKRLPLAVSNLFLDYLYCKDEEFRTDFALQDPKSLKDHIEDVVSTNIHNGYWVITGANSGIGHALARELNASGKKLILIDKDIENISSFKEQIILKADLSRLHEIERIAGTVEKYKIFCLINNAGVGFRGGLKDISMEKIMKTIEVNVSYPVLFTKLLSDSLVRNGSVIVNVASSIAYNPLPNMSLYSASKAFLSNWSESLSYELRGTNRVITVSPSGTYTNFQRSGGVKIADGGKGLLTPEYVAQEIIRAVQGNKAVVILGSGTKVLLLISRLLPRRLNISMWGRLFERLR